MMYFITGFFAGLPLVPDCNPVDCTTEELQELFINVVNFLITTSAIITVFFIVWGGFLLLTSGGSPERISSGKKVITAAIVGLVIVLVAWVAINTFITEFTNCSGDWWKFGELTC